MRRRDDPDRTQVVRHFSSFASRYDADAFEASLGLAFISSNEIAATLSGLGRLDGARLLDAGVGTGRLARALMARGADVVGVDLAVPMLERCRARIGVPLVNAVVGPDLPFGRASFDGVLCMRVMKYLDRWPAVLREFHRLLRPGGALVIEVANARSLARWGYRGLPVSVATCRDAVRLVGDAGFVVERLDAGTRLPFVAYRWATTEARLRALRRLEGVATMLVGRRALARSFVISARVAG